MCVCVSYLCTNGCSDNQGWGNTSLYSPMTSNFSNKANEVLGNFLKTVGYWNIPITFSFNLDIVTCQIITMKTWYWLLSILSYFSVVCIS